MVQLISIVSFTLIYTIILLLDSFAMPCNKHKCCLEVLNIYSKHKCSASSSTVKLGSLIHPSLPSNEEFAICCNLECILKRSNERSKNNVISKLKSHRKQNQQSRCKNRSASPFQEHAICFILYVLLQLLRVYFI